MKIYHADRAPFGEHQYVYVKGGIGSILSGFDGGRYDYDWGHGATDGALDLSRDILFNVFRKNFNWSLILSFHWKFIAEADRKALLITEEEVRAWYNNLC